MSLSVLTTTMSVSNSRTIIASREPTTRLHTFGLKFAEGKYLFLYTGPANSFNSSIKNIIVGTKKFNVIRILGSSVYVLAEFENEVEGMSHLEKNIPYYAQEINNDKGVRVGFIVFEKK